mmetsp:Transcript_6218/g.11060  ORF Transcript_6218/g.11060 Transcript_6218/m.11060 type:complete len:694 (+) Transcript_6218:244-2325(+)
MSTHLSQRALVGTVIGAAALSIAALLIMRKGQQMKKSKTRMLSSSEHLGLEDRDAPVQRKAVYVPIDKKVQEETSFSNFHECVATHLSLDLTVDFTREVLAGTLVISAKVKKNGTSELVLDTVDVSVSNIKISGPWGRPSQEATFFFGPRHKAFGSALRISIPEEYQVAGTQIEVEISYETASGGACSAAQWLPAEQTAGKAHPYLFTQCQSIHCRSLFPCQDAPAVKTTYDASITVPAPLVALMSAVSTGSESTGTRTVFTFRQDVPVSSYLIAIVVGNLESRDLGPRTRVWSEPSVVELAAYEFTETELFLKAAEDLCGDYVWGRYDLLMLPPSFPYGGMECPNLTLVTPTLCSGDRSLFNVIAHEIAHSWSGNLVTNATWADFWINEGMTVFIERRIIAKVYGDRTAALKQRAGWGSLARSVEHLGDCHEFTCLHIKMGDLDPDDCYSTVPYEKGNAFISYLEHVAGGEAAFEPFLKAYILRFQYGTVSFEDLRAFYLHYFTQQGLSQEKLDTIDWDEWIHKPGMPAYQPKLDTTLIDAVVKVAHEEWIAKGRVAGNYDTKWTSDQKIVLLETFLEALHSDTEFDTALIDRIDTRYGFSSTRNSEILFKWLLFCLRAGDSRKAPAVAKFLGEQGRMKYVRPLYRQLSEGDKVMQEAAIQAFRQYRGQYHAIASKMICRDLISAGLLESDV